MVFFQPPPPAPVMASEQPDPSSYWHSDSEHSFLELSSLARHDYEFVRVLDPWVDVAELMAEDEGRWNPGGDAKPGGYLELTDQQLKEVKLDLNGRQLVVRQDTALLLEPGVTGSVVWDGGVALPLLVEEWRDAGVIGPLSDLCVWELGAGVGLTSCGLLALGAKHVVATDQSHMIPTLESNLRRNFPDCGCFTCGTLDWDDAETEIATLIRDGAPRCDMIVISDTWYNECIAKALVDALVAVAKTAPDGRKYTPCIALEEMRSADCLVGFLEEVLSRGITVVRVVKESIRYAGLSGHGRMIVFLFQL